MIQRSDSPKDGDFLAYIERATGKPPANPERYMRETNKERSRQAAAQASAPRPAPSVPQAGNGAGRPAQTASRPHGFSDADLAILAPIGRGLTIAGFAVIAAAILLGDWFPLPSPFAGVVLVVLGVILRRIGRGLQGSLPKRNTASK